MVVKNLYNSTGSPSGPGGLLLGGVYLFLPKVRFDKNFDSA